MDRSDLTDVSKNLTSFQKGKLSLLLKAISREFEIAGEKDLGTSIGKKRLVQFYGKEIKKFLSITDGDRLFLDKLLDLLVREAILIPTGVITVKSNEEEEDRYGHPISILIPADFEERRRAYEQNLERLYQEKVRASMTPARIYEEPSWWIKAISFLGKVLFMTVFIPLYFLWNGGKKFTGDVGNYVYRGMVILVGGYLLYLAYQWTSPFIHIEIGRSQPPIHLEANNNASSTIPN